MIAVDKLPIYSTLDLHKSVSQGDVMMTWEVACDALAQRLAEELKAAKSSKLSCGELLVPDDLLPQLARDILGQCLKEPCGLRGCTLDIQLESEDGSLVKISSINWDPCMSSTFHLELTLRQDSRRKWRLSHLLRLLTKGRTLVLDSNFNINKTRHYRLRAPAR